MTAAHPEATGPCSSALGFGWLRETLAGDEITALLASLQELAGHSRAGARHLLRSARVTALAADPRLVGPARAILGPTAVPFRATLFDKSLSSNWLVAWHQDTVLPLRERTAAAGWGPWSVKRGVLHAGAPAEALALCWPCGSTWTSPRPTTGRCAWCPAATGTACCRATSSRASCGRGPWWSARCHAAESSP